MSRLVNVVVSIFVVFSILFFQDVHAQNVKTTVSHKTPDYRAIFKEQKSLAEKGDPKAQSIVGLMYRRGMGVEQNDKEAMKWMRKAAEQGNAGAQYNLANLLSNKNKNAEAVQWYAKSAKQGNVDSMYNLAVMIYNGEGVRKDKGVALQWYRRAAEGGHLESQAVLGAYYSVGIPGVLRKDKKEAVRWLSKAAAKGHPGAKIDLEKYR